MKILHPIRGPVAFMEKGDVNWTRTNGTDMKGEVLVMGKGLATYLPEAAILCDGRPWVICESIIWGVLIPAWLPREFKNEG